VSQPLIRLTHQCFSDDLFEEVTDRAAAEALLRGYRGDAAAMDRLRAVLAVTDQDIFRRSENAVLAAAAGKILKGELRVKKDPCERKSAENRQYLDWILAYRNDAAEIAATLKTSVQNILGLAAVESEFGKNRWAREGNNFFALSTTRDKPLPGQIGLMIAMGDPKLGMAKFQDFLACGKAFAQTTGQIILDEADPARFAATLQNRGKFGTGPQGPIHGYVKELTDVIREMAIRLNC
jgi:hypothetical protein